MRRILTPIDTDKAKLVELIKRKAEISEDLKTLEMQIYSLEECFLNNGNRRGSLMRGLDSYLTSDRDANENTISKAEKNNQKIRKIDRIFSKSSITSPTDEPDSYLIKNQGFNDKPNASNTTVRESIEKGDRNDGSNVPIEVLDLNEPTPSGTDVKMQAQ